MNDKIKELSEKRDLAMAEMYKALFVRQNATVDYLEKSEIFNKIDAQFKQAIQEEAHNDATKH